MFKGIDISHWNEIDWNVLNMQTDTIDFIIIKLGTYTRTRFIIDPSFYNNYNNAKEHFKVGCYIYVNGNAYTSCDKTSLMYMMETLPYIWGLKFDMPIFLDVEEFPAAEFYGDMAIFIETWLAYMEAARFYVGVYSSYAYFKNYLFTNCHNKLKSYVLWVARWGNVKPEFGQIWQKTNKGQLAGITAYVDLNETNIDYAKAIKKNKLNGYLMP